MWCILSKLDVVFTSWLCLIGVSCRLGRGRSGSLLAGPVSYRVGSYKWHSAMWYKSFSVKIRCRKILKCHADLGRVQVAATLPTGPLCVQWRQQQLISGALFHVGIGKRHFMWKKSIDRLKLPRKDEKTQLSSDVQWRASTADLRRSFTCRHRERLFLVKKLIVHLICWGYITQSESEVLMCVGWLQYLICVTRLKSSFSERKVKSTTTAMENRFAKFKLKCSSSKGRRGHTYISEQLS